MPTAGLPSPLTLDELFEVLADISRAHERRFDERVEHRKRIVVICQESSRAILRSDIRLGWIEDVSTSGARLSLPHSVTADRFWVRMLGAEAQDPFTECRVQWRNRDATVATEDALQTCGVRFERLLNGREFEEVLGARVDEAE